MKLLRLSTFTLLTATLFFTGCKGKSPKELIVNKWKLTEITGDGANGIPDAEKKEMIDKVVMDLSKDGKCSMTGKGDSPKTGTYTISDDGKTLTLIHDGSDKGEAHDINELTGSKLVLAWSREKMKMTFTAN